MANFETPFAFPKKETDYEKNKARRNAIFAIALSTFIHHDTASQAETESLKEHAVLERMVEKGPVKSDDCEKTFSKEFQSLAFHEKKEAAFAAIYTPEGTCQITALGHGEEGGVTTDEGKAENLLKNKELSHIVFYHTHPVQLSLDMEKKSPDEIKEIQEGQMPPFALSFPSNGDFMTMAQKEIKKQEASGGLEGESNHLTEERVVTGLGIWHFGKLPEANPETLYDDSLKIGSLETYYKINQTKEPDIVKRLNSIKQGYADVSIVYAEMQDSLDYSPEAKAAFRRGDKNPLAQELKHKVELAKKYSEAMEKIGFKVTFDLHPKFMELLKHNSQ